MTSLINKINAAQAEQRLEKAWFMEQQSIKRVFGPKLWQEVVKMLRIRCDAINHDTGKKLDLTTKGESEAKIKNLKSGAYVSLEYDKTTPCLWFKTPGPSGYYSFTVEEDGSGVKFQDPNTKAPLFADEVADQLINHAV